MDIKITHRTIEPDRGTEGYWLVLHGSYGKGSVLAGYPYRGLQQWYKTLEAAVIDNPGVEVLDYSTRLDFIYQISHIPPSWFDPMDAGEVWDDADY